MSSHLDTSNYPNLATLMPSSQPWERGGTDLKLSNLITSSYYFNGSFQESKVISETWPDLFPWSTALSCTCLICYIVPSWLNDGKNRPYMTTVLQLSSNWTLPPRWGSVPQSRAVADTESCSPRSMGCVVCQILTHRKTCPSPPPIQPVTLHPVHPCKLSPAGVGAQPQRRVRLRTRWTQSRCVVSSLAPPTSLLKHQLRMRKTHWMNLWWGQGCPLTAMSCSWFQYSKHISTVSGWKHWIQSSAVFLSEGFGGRAWYVSLQHRDVMKPTE